MIIVPYGGQEKLVNERSKAITRMRFGRTVDGVGVESFCGPTMVTRRPSISVLMPVYNADRYVEAAIQSILQQSCQDFEFIIIDDGSGDGTSLILRKYEAQDRRIRLRTRPNTGIVRALNEGLSLAVGEFVARMDADDIATPERFECQLSFMHSHPKCVAAGSWVLFVDAAGDPIFTFKTPCDQNEVSNLLLHGNGGAIVHPSAMFRLEALHAAGGYRSEFEFVEDLDLYLRLMKRGFLSNVPAVLLKYRQHVSSVNFTAEPLRRHQLSIRLVNLARYEYNLPELAVGAQRLFKIEAESIVHRRWAAWALEENFLQTAAKHALLALWCAPRERVSWAFLKLVIERICRVRWALL